MKLWKVLLVVAIAIVIYVWWRRRQAAALVVGETTEAGPPETGDLYAGTGGGMAGGVTADTPQSNTPSAEILVWSDRRRFALPAGVVTAFRAPVSSTTPTRPRPRFPTTFTRITTSRGRPPVGSTDASTGHRLGFGR